MTSYLNFTNKTEVTNVQMPEGETIKIEDASHDTKGIIQLTADVGGTAASPEVRKISKNLLPVDNTLGIGQILIAKAEHEWKYGRIDFSDPTMFEPGGIVPPSAMAKANNNDPGIITLAGDLGGTWNAPLVSKLQGKPVSANAPTTNQILQWNGTSWVPTDLVTYSPIDGSTSAKGIIQLTGDLAGTAANVTVAKINGTSVPVGGSLITGTVLRATGAASSAWGALDLANASAITGTLSVTNLPSATTGVRGVVQLAGDLGGTATSPSVLKIQAINVSATAPTSNQVLQYNGSAWAPATLSTHTPSDATVSAKGIVQLAGDLGGTATAPTVVRLGSNVAFTGSFVPTDIVNSGVSASKGELIRIKTPVIDITGSSIKDTLIWTAPPRFKVMSCLIVFLSAVSQAVLQNVNLSVGSSSGAGDLVTYNLIGNETATTTPRTNNPNTVLLPSTGIYFRRGMGTVYTGTVEVVIHGFLF